MASTAFSRSVCTRPGYRSISISSSRVSTSAHRKWFVPGYFFNAVVLSFFLISLALVLCCILYLYWFRYLSRGGNAGEVSAFTGMTDVCDVFEGNWVPSDSYPLYNSSICPFAERGFNCLANGRKDTDYLRWRWRPRLCEVPRFDAFEILERLRGKRIVFVGDSMSRTQWESLICMLMTGVEDLQSVYEINGNEISKTIQFLGVRFRSYNFTVEFFRSVFLVQQGPPPRLAPKRVKMTLKLDKMDNINRRWVDSDILIFNSGHWWTPTKLFDVGCYFQVGSSLKLGMPITSAFRMALGTWASWVESSINSTRTHVFFRTFEPSHWSGSGQKSCEVTERPTLEAKGNLRSEFTDIIDEVVAKINVPVTILNVTMMGAYRSDAHIGPWSHPSSILDCSHWCLPGVPDAWNELVFASLSQDSWH
ncbi:protein trichome berefringence-like 7 [Phalaenopsis equestris]|uniref:protein trichome berefringence-like 7 n=1 Tax=Phalaenopsis equestris TaxID=78828 RepID=UPI0009E26E15|nr:protein trichome berefringence-like 7 [Phalaenopsis equestris]